MLRKLFSSVLVLILLISSLAWISGSVAANPVSLPKPDVAPPCPPDGQWATHPSPAGQMIKIPRPCYPRSEQQPSRPTGSPPLGPSAGLLATGGPDDYGYTWNDSQTFNWINAASGPNTGVTNSSGVAGPFPIGFSFKYYENTYTQLWVGLSGLVGFNNNLNPGYGFIPDPHDPNDMLAPLLTSLQRQAGNSASKVTYLAGGITPNRYFVVQWNQVTDGLAGNTFTFQVVLRENNTIDFQYQTMTYGPYYYCPTIGIENSVGSDGLSYQTVCPYASSNQAIRFYRPAASVRVRLSPPYQGAFTHAGEMAAFQVSAHNLGDLGSDTFDLTASSAWPVSFYASDGSTALTDTNSNTLVDTGALTEGQTITLTVKIQTPITATLPEANPVVITATSALNPSKSQAVHVQTAVPAPFAQAYQDFAVDGATRLYLAHPGGQGDVNLTPDYDYRENPAITAVANGNLFYAWESTRCLDFSCYVYVTEIEATLRNNIGDVIRPNFLLADHSGAKQVTLDTDRAVAGAPDGSIGVVWSRVLFTTGFSQYNSNLFFAILNANGNIVFGPTNLTNNTLWDNGITLNIPSFHQPHLTATADNRFIITWVKETEINQSGGYVDDIWYTIRNTAGSQVKALTKFTNDTPGYGEGNLNPNVTSLTGNRALLTWDQVSNDDVYYAVLDSSGNTVKAAANLVNDGLSVSDYGADAVQLSDGKTVVAWTGWETNSNIRFAVLANSTYTLLAGPTTLTNPAAWYDNDHVSVAADAAGHAILTWADGALNNRTLYYALLDSGGSILAPPMIFLTSQMPINNYATLMTNNAGYGNTAYSLTPSANVDGVASFTGLPTFYTTPGMGADLNLRYTNVGLTPATGAVLTATLDNELTYISDTSGLTATVNGNLITWYPPDIEFLGGQQFDLQVDVPITATAGTTYPLTLELTSAGPEDNAGDNMANAQLLILYQLFLPLLRR